MDIIFVYLKSILELAFMIIVIAACLKYLKTK